MVGCKMGFDPRKPELCQMRDALWLDKNRTIQGDAKQNRCEQNEQQCTQHGPAKAARAGLGVAFVGDAHKTVLILAAGMAEPF